MGYAERAVGQSATYGDDLHVGVVVADVVAHLLQATERRKVSNAVGEDDVSGERQPGGHTREVLFGHPNVVETVRILRAKLVEHGEPQVARQQYDARVQARDIHQAAHECGSQIGRSSSASARSYSSPLGVR